MSAQQIPNLLTLRGAHRSRGAGRGRGQAPRAPPTEVDKRQVNDRLVLGTDNDASHSRLSAVNIGYLHDPFATEMSIEHTPRRFPIINRGTYVRTIAIDKLVHSFLSSNPDRDVQIVSLGAGTDTRYFRLRDQQLHKRILYHEIDFPAMSIQKLSKVRSSRALSPEGSGFHALHVVELSPGHTRWGYFSNGPQTRGYLFHPLDLTTLYLSPAVAHIDGLNPALPTLLISECCLCYLDPKAADGVLDYFSARIPNIAVAIYEPTTPSSDFGKMMMANLASRSLFMPSVLAYPSLDAQRERLRARGFTGGQDGATVEWLWENWVPSLEKERLAGLEGLDEVEEWVLLASHYLVFWAWREEVTGKEEGGKGRAIGWEEISGMRTGMGSDVREAPKGIEKMEES